MNIFTRRNFISTSGAVLASLSATVSFFGLRLFPRFGSTDAEFKEKQRRHRKLQELKSVILELQHNIKRDKSRLAIRSRAGKPCGYLDARLHLNRVKMRHYQIAYSELKGKERRQIESMQSKNPPDELRIQKIKRRFS